MVSFGLCLGPISSSASLYFKPTVFANSRSSCSYSSSSSSKFFHQPRENPNKLQGRFERGICRADVSHDAPVAAAIGACILSSFLLPVAKRDDVDDEESAITSTDTRMAAMAIISFIPYFNWLSWVFAWLDTGKRRYVVYSLAYLVPYLSSNLSISPEESWLPIASIVLGIIHVQLESSIMSGDLQTFQFFSNAAEHFSSASRNKETPSDRHHRNSEEKTRHGNLPTGDQDSRDEIPRWRIPERREHRNGGWSDDEEQ